MTKRSCLVCGSKMPLLRHVSISLFNGAECPQCHSYMTFKKRTFVVQFFLYIMLFPVFEIVFVDKNYFLGVAGLTLILLCSFFVTYSAKYVVDPAHRGRLKVCEEKHSKPDNPNKKEGC